MRVITGVVIFNIIHITPQSGQMSKTLKMTLYGMLDYGQRVDPLLRFKIAPVFFSVRISSIILCIDPQLTLHPHDPIYMI